jgi:hypothetical protein
MRKTHESYFKLYKHRNSRDSNRVLVSACFCNGGDIVEDSTEGKSAPGLVLCAVFAGNTFDFVVHLHNEWMKITYIIREKDLLETRVLIASRSGSQRKQQWIGSITVMVLIFIFSLHPDIHARTFDLFRIISRTVISVFFGGAFFFYIPRANRRYYAKQVKTSLAGMIENAVELQISSDFIETRDKDGETKMKLTAIKKVYETENLFVLQSGGGACLTVAKRDIDFAGFRDCLVSHGLNVEMVAKTTKRSCLK